jgi:hypothetical protein
MNAGYEILIFIDDMYFLIDSSLKKYLLLKMMNSNMYNRGHPKVNDSLRKFPYFSLDKIRLYSLAFVQQALLF